MPKPEYITSLEDHSDQALLSLMREGQRHAFHAIYERYWMKLYRTAVKKMRSHDDAKDLVQDVFVSLWVKRDTLVVDTSLSGYLFAAIKYKIINYIEANIVREDYLGLLDKTVWEYDNSTGEQIAADDMETLLEEGIRKLSPKTREVFELSRREELSISEIADKLHLSHQTVKNQITSALKTLRLHLYSDPEKPIKNFES